MSCMGEDGQPKCIMKKVMCLSLRVAVIIIATIDILFLVGYTCFAAYGLSQARARFMDAMLVGDVIEALTHLGVAIVLVVGIVKERRQLVRAWMWIRSVVLVTDISTLLLSSSIQAGIEDKGGYSHPHTLPYIIFGVVIIPIYSFFLVVVRSYAIELKAKDELSPTTGAATIQSDEQGNQVLR